MYRIRFHGRGGQGIKTASRILGTSFFLGGYEVQDAPRYGAERRGAPIFAFVRAADSTVHERGPIATPDLVVVVDDTLVGVPTAGVLGGLDERSVLLINTLETADTWRERLAFEGKLLTIQHTLTESGLDSQYAAVTCCGAAARLCGVISSEQLHQAISQELAELPERERQQNLKLAESGFDAMAEQEGSVTPRDITPLAGDADWIELPTDPGDVAAPAVHAPLTSVMVRTGLWRTMRPEIDYDRCSKCWWVCSTFCPDDAIRVDEENRPVIDYDYCKGCMICVAQCPPHAIAAIPESEAQASEVQS